jgi:hypothetical protein
MPHDPHRPRPANFSFVTPMPGNGDEEAALIRLLDESLEGIPGPWRVGVVRGSVVPWIVLSIFRGDGFEVSLFLDEGFKQTSLYVRDQLTAALHMHAMGIGEVGQSSSPFKKQS